ncbi:MAG: hypothetical protein R3326_03740 [Gemmatimonadota bacterium]|nr:hypothetical protein [Gemmatimonadota bacterium]
MRPFGRTILLAMLVAVGATMLAPEPAVAGCTEEYADCQAIAWGKSHWLIRELKFIECFADYVGCVRKAAGF